MKASNSLRYHIGIFGKRNSGKSSLLNTLTGQHTSIVSSQAGTTTDPIYKPMEIHSLGPVVFIDTAGFDDIGYLGELRNKKTEDIIDKCDGFLYLLSEDDDLEFLKKLEKKKKPIIKIISKADLDNYDVVKNKFLNLDTIDFIKDNEKSKKELIERIIKEFKSDDIVDITGNLVKKSDVVLLVMPQDEQAPKGRLILPQVQTIREILDKKAISICIELSNLERAFFIFKDKISLIITDSSSFKEVYQKNTSNIPLTSFSVLFSKLKGDIDYFIKSVYRLDNKLDNILISEACTHPPMDEDIGTVKIPKLIRKIHPNVKIDFKRGDDFSDIDKYDLIISCGSCMFNKAYVNSRVDLAKEKNIPMTNYGLTIAYLNGILDKIIY
ncbi:MAG: [FeFe] hydrogenase H-cluster maturation GTPase HydF [Tissierellia bacterium]|nr:[FeFe] hydrogenase H-cluster maturation GTPase HydF [Tissierellia bacterium]